MINHSNKVPIYQFTGTHNVSLLSWLTFKWDTELSMQNYLLSAPLSAPLMSILSVPLMCRCRLFWCSRPIRRPSTNRLFIFYIFTFFKNKRSIEFEIVECFNLKNESKWSENMKNRFSSKIPRKIFGGQFSWLTNI